MDWGIPISISRIYTVYICEDSSILGTWNVWWGWFRRSGTSARWGDWSNRNWGWFCLTEKNGGNAKYQSLIWVFPKIGVGPQNGWFIMETPIKMDDLGGPPLFLETPIWNFAKRWVYKLILQLPMFQAPSKDGVLSFMFEHVTFHVALCHVHF